MANSEYEMSWRDSADSRIAEIELGLGTVRFPKNAPFLVGNDVDISPVRKICFRSLRNHQESALCVQFRRSLKRFSVNHIRGGDFAKSAERMG